MQISFSTTGIFELDHPEKYINYITDAGFTSVTPDLGSFCPKYVLEDYGFNKMEYDGQTAKKQFERMIKLCADRALGMEVMRAPHLDWCTKRTDLNWFMLRMGKESLKSCIENESRYLIIQPLFSGIKKSDVWKENMRYYLELGVEAQKNGRQVLLENQCGNINGHLVRGICADAYQAAEWIDFMNRELGGEVFGYCLDTCAGNLCGQDMGEMAVTLGSRLKVVLLRECDGLHEAGRLPFTGHSEAGDSVEWRSLILGLRKISFDGILIIDAKDTLRGFSHLLRQQLYPVIQSVGEYFKWQIMMERRLRQYSSRVLFGAGTMCRNYMKFYGEEYPPMFLCDNNPGLWGKDICGLEVKSPEELKYLPVDCAVIICNMYYREIGEQLKKMGIRHIETFSDEYLCL